MLELCEKKINYSFVIFFDNQIVGRISLLREESLDYPEVGIHIFSEFRGRNIGFDATSLFFNWLVNNTQISRIYWESLIDNKPSQKLIEKFNPIKQTEIKEIEFEGKIEKYYVYEKNLLETSIPHKHLLLEKTQKILDRLIFIMFCEDEYLLPSNILKQTFELGKKSRSRSKTKIWEEFKYLFEDIDKGRYDIQPHINAFNGGLFADDTELNNLMIKDEIWQDLIKLAEYDFESDLNVNILGHIFEQSIADIEEIKADLEANPQNSTNFDPLEPNPQLSTKVDPLEGVSKTKKTSKRKKDGIYYTPEYITDYIVSETVDSWITENKQELEKITILDPAGGSGAFPNQVHNFLTKKWVEKMNQIALDSNLEALADFDEISIDKSILKNNIFMVDLQPESVEIAKLSLWLKTARKDQKLNNLDKNVKCGNSLISDPEIAGGTAFDWDKEFPEVMASGGFDVVVGNPPYVNAKNGNFTEKEKEYLYKNYETAEYQLDAYILFIEKAIRLLKDGGYTGFIIPNAWLGNVFVPKIREFLLKNTEIKQIVELGNTVFEDANVDTVILIVKKCTPNPEHEIKVGHFVEQKYEFRHTVKQSLFLKNKGFVFDINLNDKNREIIEKIEENSVLIDDILEVSTGIKEYQVGKGKPAQTQQDKNELRFNANFKKDDSFVPELRGKNIDRYESHWQNEFVSYGEWIAEPRKPKFFEGERVLLRKIPAPENLVATFTDEKFVIDQSLYIALNEEKKFNTKYILACLNSKILGWYFKYKNNEFDGLFPQIKINQFKSLPIPTATPAEQAQIAQLVDEIMELKKDLKNYIQNTFTLWNNEFGQTIKINKKLENFHILTFEEFLNELKKQKINPTRDQKREAIQGFESDKQKVISKMAEIERVDGEIEGVVRGLYGV